MTPPITDPDNERRLELHFPPLTAGGGQSVSTSLPLAITPGLASDEWLRPEYLVLLDAATASAFHVVALSLRHSEFNGYEVVLPMQLEQKDLGETGVTYRVEASEAPPSQAFIYLTVRNLTDEEQTFRGAMTLVAVRGGIRPAAPFTPISSPEPKTRKSAPSFWVSFNDNLRDAFTIMIQGLKGVRQEYIALKNTCEEVQAAKSYLDQQGGLYPSFEAPQPETFSQIISQAVREGLSLATFPLRVGSMMAGKGIEDLRGLLSGDKKKLEGNETILPCQPTDVDPGNEAALIIEPLVRMVPTRLVIHWEVANDFSLVDFKVGKNSQLLSHLPIAFSLLAGLGESTRLKMEEAGPGKSIQISVRNTSAKTAKFRAIVIGYVVG